MKVRDILAAVEEFAPLGVQEGWDNSGLLVGSPDDEVHGVTIGFDATAALMEDAHSSGCDLVIVHHPLIFGGLKKIDPADPAGEAIYAAIRSGIAVYATHTPADKVPGGVSWAMAGRLPLVNVRVLDDEGGVGLGVVGDLQSPLGGEEAVAMVKEAFGLAAVRCSKPVAKVDRIALCGGSGSSLIGAAMRSGAQLFVTGDITYHKFFTPKGFMLMDIGHFESEKDIVGILFKVIRKNFPNFAVRTASSLENPVHYM